MFSRNFIPRHLLKRKKKMSTKTHTKLYNGMLCNYQTTVNREANCGLSVVWNSRLQQETDDQCILHHV